MVGMRVVGLDGGDLGDENERLCGGFSVIIGCVKGVWKGCGKVDFCWNG